MTEQSEHLSNAQIENYGIRTSGAGPDAAQRDEHQRLDHQSIDGLMINDQSISDQRVEAHLADCAPCRNRLLGFHRSLFTGATGPPEANPPENDPSQNRISPSGPRFADAKLEGARPTDSALVDSKFANSNDPADPQVRTAPTPECPSTEALRELAAGLTPDDLAPTLTRHAATCDHCGPLLRTFTEDFSDDFTPEEQAALNNLQSASADWQKNTARKMLEAARVSAASAASSAEVSGSGTTATVKSEKKSSPLKAVSSASDGKRFFWKWALVPAVAAAVIVGVVGFGILAAKRDTPEKVEALFAQAYTQQRTMEIRWPGAEWGPVRVTRGSQDSKPASLFEAEVIIGQHNTSSNDVDWLRAKAQSEIMEWNPRAAITLLEQALDIAGKSTAIQLDLSNAYFQMGELSHDSQNYEKAIGLIRSVLKEDTKSRIALYNRAVLDERLNRLDDAAKDWQAVLNTETDPQWLREADLKYKALMKPR